MISPMPLSTILLTMFTAQLFDLATFIAMVRRLGPAAEANPVVLGVMTSGGVGAVIAVKLTLIVLVGAVAVVLNHGGDHRARRAGALLLGCAILAGVFGGWTNALTIAAI